MNPIATLLRCCRQPAPMPPRQRRSRVAEAAEAHDADADADPAGPDAVAGCGWYDSSNDLRLGLVVREHATVEPLGPELPLADWIELRLQGWQGLPSA